MVDAISHIVDKIKTRNTTYVLGLFVDFSDAFACLDQNSSPSQGTSKYPLTSTICFDLTSRIERSK
jgi:hypothetical protein